MVVEIEGKTYIEDGQGRLVPVKAIDSERDALVTALHQQAEVVRKQVADFRRQSVEQFEAFYELSMEKWGVKVGGNQGNASLSSIDGNFKVEVATSKRIGFDEQLQAAKALIDGCLADWCKGANDHLVRLIGQAFEADRYGQLRTDKVVELLKYDIEDAKWERAMSAIKESMKVVSTRQQIRFYGRDDSGSWRQIVLDFSRM